MKTFEMHFAEFQVAIPHKVYSAVEIDAIKVSQSCVCYTAHAVQKIPPPVPNDILALYFM